MSHIVAIYRRSKFTDYPFLILRHNGTFGFWSHDQAREELDVCGQSVDWLPEVGECILVDPPAPPVEPPPIDWWLSQRHDAALFRCDTRLDATNIARADYCTGLVGHIWRDDDGLHETWERVK
jgi:hypothetical protein